MTRACPNPETLAELLDLPVDDPRRVHLASCPRCRARSLAFRAFMAAEGVDGARAEDAVSRLDARLEAEIAAGVSARRSGPARGSWLDRLMEPLRAPGLRPLVAGVAIAVVVAGVWFARGPQQGDRVLRGDPPAGSSAADPILLEARSAPGGVVLRWRGVPNADGYAVIVYAPDLTERARLGPLTDTSAVLPPESLTGVAPGTVLSWKVVALERGDPAGRSRLGQFRAP